MLYEGYFFNSILLASRKDMKEMVGPSIVCGCGCGCGRIFLVKEESIFLAVTAGRAVLHSVGARCVSFTHCPNEQKKRRG